MDVDLIVYVDEDGYEVYDMWEEDIGDDWEKFFDCLDKVKRFDYDDLIVINDIEK